MSGYLLWWTKLPSLVRYTIGVLSAFCAVLALFLFFMSKLKDMRDEAFAQGQTQVREQASAAVIENVETSHEIRRQFDLEAARGSSDVIYANCVRSARTPENCQRFLPRGSEDSDRAVSDQRR